MEGALTPERGALAAGRRGVSVGVVAQAEISRRRLIAGLATGNVTVTSAAATLDELAESAGLEPDVILLYGDAVTTEGMAALRRARRRSRWTPIVIVLPVPHVSAVRRALHAGVDGVIFDAQLEHVLAATLTAVAAGMVVLPHAQRESIDKPALSHREKQVLTGAVMGLTNSEIATRLYLAESTVKSHLSASFAKLGVRSRKQAAALVLDPDEGLSKSVLAPDIASRSPGPGRGTA